MFGVASATAVFTSLLANVSTMLGTVIVAVFTIFAALLGLGIGIHYVRKYIARRKA